MPTTTLWVTIGFFFHPPPPPPPCFAAASSFWRMRVGERTGQSEKQLFSAGEIPTWQWLWSVSTALTWDGFSSHASRLNLGTSLISRTPPRDRCDHNASPPHTLSHTYTHAHAHTWEVDLSLESREREREKKKGKERGSAASAIRASGQSRQRVCVEETSSEQPAAHLGIVHVQFVIWQVSRFASDALCVTGYLFICRWSAPAPRRAWIAQARTRRLHRWLPVCVCRLCGTPNRKKPQLGCTHTLTHTHAEAFFPLPISFHEAGTVTTSCACSQRIRWYRGTC